MSSTSQLPVGPLPALPDEDPAPPFPMPPRGADLPTEDDVPMESLLHRLLMTLLIEVLELAWADRKDFFTGGNMFFYFSSLQTRDNSFRGPDFFVVLDTEHRARASWVTWEEDGQAPNVILEILSPSTEKRDRGEKRRVYERLLRIPEYFLYDPRTGLLEGYRLGAQRHYEPIPPTAEGRLPSQQLGLLLGVQEGAYQGYRDRLVRLYSSDGRLLPTAEEARDQAEARATAAEAEAARLRELLAQRG